MFGIPKSCIVRGTRYGAKMGSDSPPKKLVRRRYEEKLGEKNLRAGKWDTNSEGRRGGGEERKPWRAEENEVGLGGEGLRESGSGNPERWTAVPGDASDRGFDGLLGITGKREKKVHKLNRRRQRDLLKARPGKPFLQVRDPSFPRRGARNEKKVNGLREKKRFFFVRDWSTLRIALQCWGGGLEKVLIFFPARLAQTRESDGDKALRAKVYMTFISMVAERGKETEGGRTKK